MDMDAKRRQQQQQQQQQLCVQALHHQTMNNHCAHAAPLGYLTSPWVMWDAGRVAETTRRRKRKKRLCTACLLAGVAVAILAVAGVAGLAVYLGGSPPTEGTTKWESFRRAGEPRQGEEVTTHRVHGKHGILLRAETPEKSTPPSRSPWSIRREEGVKWEGRGGGGGEAGASPEEIPHEDHLDYPYGSSEGIPEVEVVLEDGETDALGDRGADREESVTENQSERSPFARASEARRPLPLPSALLPDNTRNHFSLTQEDRESHLETTDAELTTSVDDLAAENADDEGRQDTGVQKRNQWNWSSDMEDEAGMYGVSSDEEVDTAEADEEEAEESEEDDQAVDGDKREEREGGEERRQHHPSNKLATEGIPVFNMLTKILKRLNSSSNSKEVDMPDTSNGTIECSPSQFRCAAPNEGIMCLPASSRCDGVRDCTLSGEDESGCTCADALRSRFLHRKLCDGVPDCWDYSDEDQCEWCTPGYMLCGGGARTCIEPKRICDGVKDCPGGDDESRCIALSSEEVDEEPKTMGLEARKVYQRGGIRSNTSRGLNYVTPSMVTNEVLPYRSSGYLLVRKKGVWGKLCLDGSEDKERRTRQDSSELNVAEIGYEVCKAMTHRDFEVVEQVTDDENFKNKSSTSLFSPYYQLQHGSINSEILGSMQGIHKTECSSKKVIRVKCKDLECGVRPKIKVNQWSRIVGGGNAAPGAWPWQAALYREGEFQCGATLISDHWLVSAGHCFFHARDDYWVARLGTLRRGTDLPSPHEQRRPVSSIILHAGYVDAGFLNDIALLRLSSPVEITDHVRPACLPPRALHISTPSTREIHVEQTTNNEEILYTYDEAVTTFSPMLNSDVGIKTEANTNIPYSKEELNYLKSNTPPKDMPFWEGTIEESDEYTSVHNERKTTSMPSNISDEPKQIIHLIREHHHNQSEGTHLKSTLSSMQSTKFNQSNVHYPNMNDQGADTHTITPTFLTNIDLPNKEFESVEYKMEMITLQPDKSETQGNEIRKNLNQGTESITMDDDSILLQHTSPQSITEYQKKKNLSSQVLSTHQSSNLRPINPDILTSNQNVIQTIDTRGKEEKDNLYLDESTKTTLPYNKQVEKTTKYVTVDIEMPTNNTNEIKEEFADFSVTKVTDSNKIISKVKVGQDTVFKQTSDAVNVTSENVMKTEQMQNNPKLLEERPDMPNILISDGKILLNKNNSDNYKMDSSIEYGAEKTDQENVKFASNYPMVTESITFIPDTKEPLLESIKLSIKDRKIRNVDEDDLDDGIRNGRLCTVVGWGQLFEVGRIFPDTLQEVELPLISTSECRKRTLYLPLYHLTDAMFCAGYDRGGRDACLGDSGGPLMCQEPDGHWSLYGVTSNGYGCARANRPGVYTKVSHYIPWMEEVMFQEDAYQEEWLKKGEREVKDEEGGEDGWKQRWEWRKRKGEEQGTGGKQYCPHRCPLGECLQRARVCNGVVDCSDASDEDNCQGETNMGR